MQDPAPLPGFAAIVVAAGQGLRAGQPLPKQFARWRGKPVLRHSVEGLLAAGASPLVIAVPENGEQAAQAALVKTRRPAPRRRVDNRSPLRVAARVKAKVKVL